MIPYSEEGTFLEQPNSKPSIQVGAQVRLTGVVASRDGGFVWVDVGFQRLCIEHEETLEVIRQPFKRGEVVYRPNENIPCVVLVSESNGKVVLTEAREGAYAREMDADKYERRP